MGNAGGIGIFHYPNIFNFPKNNPNLGQNNDILSFPKFGPHSTREIPKQARYFWSKLHDLSPI